MRVPIRLIFRFWGLKEFQRRYWPVKVGFLFFFKFGRVIKNRLHFVVVNNLQRQKFTNIKVYNDKMKTILNDTTKFLDLGPTKTTPLKLNHGYNDGYYS